MSKTTQDTAALLREERELTHRLLEKLQAKSGRDQRPEDTRVATSPFKRDDTPGKPKPTVPVRQITSSDFIGLIEDTLSKAEKSQEGPVSPGLGLKQGKASKSHAAGSEWTISNPAPKPSEQRDEKGKQLRGDDRIAFYAHPPGENVKDLPITVGEIRKFELEPPAVGSTSDRKGK